MTNYLGGLIFASKLNEARSEHGHMTMREGIAKALKARLSELKSRVAKIESELRTPLSADTEEQATELENQDALASIGNSEIHEIRQTEEALKRISEGAYGVCVQCGVDFPKPCLRPLATAAALSG